MPHTSLTALLAQPSAVWYVLGLCGLILLELVVALLAWMTWIEQPPVKVQ